MSQAEVMAILRKNSVKGMLWCEIEKEYPIARTYITKMYKNRTVRRIKENGGFRYFPNE